MFRRIRSISVNWKISYTVSIIRSTYCAVLSNNLSQKKNYVHRSTVVTEARILNPYISNGEFSFKVTKITQDRFSIVHKASMKLVF